MYVNAATLSSKGERAKAIEGMPVMKQVDQSIQKKTATIHSKKIPNIHFLKLQSNYCLIFSGGK